MLCLRKTSSSARSASPRSSTQAVRPRSPEWRAHRRSSIFVRRYVRARSAQSLLASRRNGREQSHKQGMFGANRCSANVSEHIQMQMQIGAAPSTPSATGADLACSVGAHEAGVPAEPIDHASRPPIGLPAATNRRTGGRWASKRGLMFARPVADARRAANNRPWTIWLASRSPEVPIVGWRARALCSVGCVALARLATLASLVPSWPAEQ